MFDLKFPIIKNISGKLLSNDIVSAKPMTLQEAAKGREIKEIEHNYQEFRNIDDLKKYILKKVESFKGSKKEWLDVHTGYSLPLIHSEKYYFVDTIGTITIECNQPKKHVLDDIVYGQTICRLDPRKWNYDVLKNVIDELKTK